MLYYSRVGCYNFDVFVVIFTTMNVVKNRHIIHMCPEKKNLTNFTMPLNVNITWKSNLFTKFLTGKINKLQQNHVLFDKERVDFFVEKHATF